MEGFIGSVTGASAQSSQLDLDRRAAEAQPSDIRRPNPFSQVLPTAFQRVSPRESSSHGPSVLVAASGDAQAVGDSQTVGNSQAVGDSQSVHINPGDAQHSGGDQHGQTVGDSQAVGDSQPVYINPGDAQHSGGDQHGFGLRVRLHHRFSTS